MVLRRLLYGLTLLGVLLFHITNENYLGQFLLALCLALPLLSLVLSLPGLLGCRLELSALPAALERGEEGRWQVSIRTSSALPLARLTLRLTGENLLTGETDRKRMTLLGVTRRRPARLAAPTAHCGLLELRVDRAWACDHLGLFSLPVPLPSPARMVCGPIPAQVQPPRIPEGQGARTTPASASQAGPGEDYDLRDYRPGDPMRSVHWKLSSKWDELIVRERSEALIPLPLLTLDRFGPPEALDRLLDRLAGLSRSLLDIQRPHGVLWLDRDGQPQLRVVSDEKQFSDCLLDLLGSFAPLDGPSLEERPELLRGPDGPVFRIHVDQEGGNGHG